MFAAAALAIVGVPGAVSLLPRTGPGKPWTLEEFLAAVTPAAKQLVADTSRAGQDRYLHTVAGLAAQLGDVDEPDYRQVSEGHWIGCNHEPEPFTVLHWKLAPGAKITPHAHSYGNVVTLGLAGAVRVFNYEMVGERDYDAKGRFRVQCTVDQVVRKGDINLVSLERHYVHGFVAGPDGARGLDITTRILAKRPSPVLDVAPKPIDEQLRVFEAGWTN